MSWLVLQIGSLLAGSLELPALLMDIVIFFTIVAFPFVLVFAWAYELTPGGLKRAAEVLPEDSVTKQTARKLDFAIMTVMAAVIVVLVLDRFVIGQPNDTGTASTSSDESVPSDENSYDSIAVLPFVNMSNDPEQEYFSDGISEELLNLLAKTRGLRVAARTSSFSFKGEAPDIREVGEALGVETVLEGSVRQSGTRLRITAQLINASNGYHMWSETYDRELTDVFEIQDEISAAIVDALKGHLGAKIADLPKARKTDVAAFNAYLKGRQNMELRTKDSLALALAYFDLALQKDPDYAPAWSGKADTYLLLKEGDGTYGEIPLQVTQELAAPLIDRALALDPEIAEAWASRGLMYYHAGRYDEAATSLDRAIELNPSLSRAHMWKALNLGQTGKVKESVEAFEQAHAIDPMSLVVVFNLAMNTATGLGDFDRALGYVARLKELAPDRPDRYAVGGIFVNMFKGDISEAWRIGQEMKRDHGIQAAAFPYFMSLMEIGEINELRGSAPPGILFMADIVEGRWTDAEARYKSMDAAIRQDDDVLQGAIILGLHRDDHAFLGELTNTLEIRPWRESPWFNARPGKPFTATTLLLALKRVDADEKAALLRSEIAKAEAEIEVAGVERFDLMNRAQMEVINGNPESAMKMLKEAWSHKFLSWYDRSDPMWKPLQDRAEFQALFAEVDAHLNRERAEAGLPPMGKRSAVEMASE